MEWYVKCWRQYADFSGRARRKEYWMFSLFNVLIVFVLAIVLPMLFGLLAVSLMQMQVNNDSDPSAIMLGIGYLPSIALALYGLAVMVPSLAVSVRRLHDIGKSGWTILLGLIPFVGGIILLVFCCQDSQPQENKWGASPKA